MRYVSTHGTAAAADARTALAGVPAPDGGLYMPERIPLLPRAFFNNISDMSLAEIAYVVASSFFSDRVPAAQIKRIVDDSFSFNAPLVKLKDDTYVLELFHGPTLTFKDYAARFLARLVSNIDSARRASTRTVLVATTGNSGAATANGLHGIPGVNVVVLYPKGVLSRMQLSQFTTLGGNVLPVEVDGTIEDCKNMLHEALTDRQLAYLNVSTANSFNVGRLIPQMVFPLHAYARLKATGVRNADQAFYAVPCGNCSNLLATLMAAESGLPLGGIVAACNANGALNRLHAGLPCADQPFTTLAPGLDVSKPSCLDRLTYMRNRGYKSLAKVVLPDAVDDREIAATVLRLYAVHGYTIDPHGAVAYAAQAKIKNAAPRVIFATGHPAMSLDTMTRITARPVELPVQFNRFMGGRRYTRYIPATMAALRRLLIML